MSIYFGSFGGIKLHADTHLLGGSDEITGELNPLIYAQVAVQDVIAARNKIGSVTVTEAQSWINGFGNLLNDVPGLLCSYTMNYEGLHFHDAEASIVTTSPTKLKTITLDALNPSPATIRIAYAHKTDGSVGSTQIYKNGEPFGAARPFSNAEYVVVWEELAFADGDAIELWGWNVHEPIRIYVINLRIYGEVIDNTLAVAVANNDAGASVPFAATNS